MEDLEIKPEWITDVLVQGRWLTVEDGPEPKLERLVIKGPPGRSEAFGSVLTFPCVSDGRAGMTFPTSVRVDQIQAVRWEPR